MGSHGQDLFNQLMVVLRQSLSTAITDLFTVAMGVMLLGFLASLFLSEIPLRKTHGAQEVAPTGTTQATMPASSPVSRPDGSRAILGLSLALMARKAQRPDADRQLLATLASTADGRFPHDWSEAERGRAVAREVIKPLAVALLNSYVNERRANGHGATVHVLNGREDE
jgi:HAMP domain-containing protein